MLWKEIGGPVIWYLLSRSSLKIKFRVYLGKYSDSTVEYILVNCFLSNSVGDSVC